MHATYTASHPTGMGYRQLAFGSEASNIGKGLVWRLRLSFE